MRLQSSLLGWTDHFAEALDGEGANSPFSAALSRHIGTPGLKVLTRARRSRRRHPVQAGAVVEFVAAWRGISGREVMTCSHTVIPWRCEASNPKSRDPGFASSTRPGMTPERLLPPHLVGDFH